METEGTREAPRETPGNSLLLSSCLSALSHGIRTPLNAIIGFSGLLMDTGISRQEQETYAKLVNRNSRRLLDMMTNLVDLAKMETGKLVLYPKPVTISRMADDLRREIREIQKAYDRENVEMVYRVPAKVPDPIVVDWARLFQIIKILADNSLKFTTTGKITIEMVNDDPNNLVFRITDEGRGMDQETLDRLFDLFPLKEKQNEEKIQTRGLAMMLVKRLCDMMSIRMRIDSAPGSGTSVTLIVPKGP